MKRFNWPLLALKMEGAMSQRMLRASKSRKRGGNDSPLGPLKKKKITPTVYKYFMAHVTNFPPKRNLLYDSSRGQKADAVSLNYNQGVVRSLFSLEAQDVQIMFKLSHECTHFTW